MSKVLPAAALSLAVLLSTACSPPPPAQREPAPEAYRYLRSTTAMPYEDVVQFVEVAITDRGYKIDNHAYIGRMLERTKEALGETETVYLHAEQFRFCPARYSRNMLGADPHNIVFCPYIINVYNLPAEPDRTYVSFRRPLVVGSPASKKALADVDKLLSDIINEALQ